MRGWTNENQTSCARPAQPRAAVPYASLSAARVPNRSRTLIVQPFAPHHVRIPVVVDRKSEIVAKWKTETFLTDITIARYVARNPDLFSPGRAAVARTPIVSVPIRGVAGRVSRSVALIHPRHAHVAGIPCHNRRESMFHRRFGVGNADPRQPVFAAVGR